MAVERDRTKWPEEVSRKPDVEFYRPKPNEKEQIRRMAPALYSAILGGFLIRREPAIQYAEKT